MLNRLTFASTLSHLRRVNSPIGRDGKLAKPRQLHNTLWGMICPAETPEVSWLFFVINEHIFLSVYTAIALIFVFTLGSCCRISKKSCPYGLHFCWFSAITYLRVFRRMEHGKSGRNCPFCYCRVSNFIFLTNNLHSTFYIHFTYA